MHFIKAQIIDPLLHWYSDALTAWGYWLVALFMAIESSFLPLPSEVVLPPAAHLAWNNGIPFLGLHLTGWPAQIGLVMAGALGSWLGATGMYWASRWAGRPLVMRYGKYVLIPPPKVEGAERCAAHYGALGIFISRLLPVVRHLIGIPAGIVRLDYRRFSLYTLLGSALWCAVLCYVGVRMGQDLRETQNVTRTISTWLGGGMLVLGAIYYFFVHRQMKGKSGVRRPKAEG